MGIKEQCQGKASKVCQIKSLIPSPKLESDDDVELVVRKPDPDVAAASADTYDPDFPNSFLVSKPEKQESDKYAGPKERKPRPEREQP